MLGISNTESVALILVRILPTEYEQAHLSRHNSHYMWGPCALGMGKKSRIWALRCVWRRIFRRTLGTWSGKEPSPLYVSSVNARKMHHCSTWVAEFRDTATVDQILIEGDRMYFNALQNQNIPDTETMSLIYLPNQARWNFQSPFEVTKWSVEANTIALWG